MKNTYAKSVIILIVFTMLITSCKKDEQIIEGCTDSSAMNYLSNSTSDDGSCIFAHEVMINTWTVNSTTCDFEGLGVLPTSITVQEGSVAGDLKIDFGTAGEYNGSIDNNGNINIPSQTAFVIGSISGDGTLTAESSTIANVTINLTITIGAPPLGTTQTCSVDLSL